jgi:hypothetical protein
VDVDQGAVDTDVSTRAPAGDGAAALEDARPRRVGREVTLIAVVCAAVLIAAAVGGFLLYRALYSPTAFVERYLTMLSEGHAADALRVPGVGVDRSVLRADGLPGHASEALLRQAALAPLTDVSTVSETTKDGVVEVRVRYTVGTHRGTTTFEVARQGWTGVVPAWRFARSPLAVLDLTVHGSMGFEVNGFAIDKRQVSPDGADADPSADVPLLVFSPGLYSVRVDTAMASSPGVAVLSDTPMKRVSATVQAKPTAAFVTVVQQRVDEFLASCATQQVLQPTGCPFGYVVQNRIEAPPTWSITQQPKVALSPDGEGWRIPPTTAVAHIVVDIRSIYDGSLQHVDEDVPFAVAGSIAVEPDGTASIRVTSPGLD